MTRVLVALACVAVCPFGAVAEWPVFRGDATMTGVGTAKLPDQLEIKWSFKTGDGVESAPAVVNGIAYVSSLDKHLYAIDVATGKQKWKTKLGSMKASPSVKGDRVYVGDLNGFFFCVSAADGKVVWKFEAEGEIAAAANFHGNNAVFGSHDSNLYCLDPEGKKVWATKVDGPINAAAAIVGDKTFATGCSDGILHVIDARNGKELGALDLGGQSMATAAVVGDRLYLSMVSNQVVAADLKELKKLWAFEAPKRQQPFYSSAAVSEGLVVSGSRDKKVYAIDAKTGAEKWNFETDGQVDASPVVVGGRVYVGCLSNDGNFYVLDLKTGKKLQEIELDSAISGSAAVGPDCILVGTDKGTVYCLGKK